MISGASPSLPQQQAAGAIVDSHRVLRNTYWLLALSMLPTVAGALAGMQLNFIGLFKAAPIMTPLLMFGVMLGSLFLVTRLRNSAAAVPALFAFTFIAGLMLTPILTVAAGLRNGGQLVALSGGLTAAVFFGLAAYATTTKRDFGFLGRFLFIGTVLLLVGFLVSIFLPIPTLTITLSAIAVLLFSLWLLHDLSRIITGGETNYVMATLALFLDIYNIFINLLSLLMVFAGNRD
jgi:FtsH-binding integral membrane protein